MFEIPSRDDVEAVVITEECIRNRTAPKLILKTPSPALLAEGSDAPESVS
jgi:ATP-dependent protease Clp ATPase subunit